MSDIGNRSVFSKNLQRLMSLSNKSRSEICKALGFKYSTFSDWVNGYKYPRIDKIEMLANYFGVEKSDLIEETTFGRDRELILFPHERELIIAYRKLTPDQQQMVANMLGVSLPPSSGAGRKQA